MLANGAGVEEQEVGFIAIFRELVASRRMCLMINSLSRTFI
jgi:hypothetical protein